MFEGILILYGTVHFACTHFRPDLKTQHCAKRNITSMTCKLQGATAKENYRQPPNSDGDDTNPEILRNPHKSPRVLTKVLFQDALGKDTEQQNQQKTNECGVSTSQI